MYCKFTKNLIFFQYQNSLKYLLSLSPPVNNLLDIQRKYIKHLYRENKIEAVLLEASKALNSFPDDTYLQEWVCKAYVELNEESSKDRSSDFSPQNAYTKLLESSPTSYLGFYCKGVHELKTGDLLNATVSLKEAAKLKPSLGSIWLKLCSSQLLLYQFSNAEETSKTALKCFYAESIKHETKKLNCKIKLLQSLSGQEQETKLFEAEKLGIELVHTCPNNAEVLEYFTRVLIKLKKFSEAKIYIAELGQIEECVHIAEFLNSLILKFDNKIEEYKAALEKLVAVTPNYFESLFELGKLLFNENNNHSCMTYFLKSAKLNQWCYLNFLYLGHCYKNMVKDIDKARRCYQKAFQLNPNSQEAGKQLSDLYRILGKEVM